MIFKPEMVEKILAGEKTVTRRPPPKHPESGKPFAGFACRYEVWKDYAVQPGRGKKAVARIRIKGVRRGRLGIGFDGGFDEARREGFNTWNDFADYWVALYGEYDADQLVDRIEFELLGDEQGVSGSGGGS